MEPGERRLLRGCARWARIAAHAASMAARRSSGDRRRSRARRRGARAPRLGASRSGRDLGRPAAGGVRRDDGRRGLTSLVRMAHGAARAAGPRPYAQGTVTVEPTSDRVRHALAFPIETPRLVIRSFEIGDAEMLHDRVFGDEETMRFIPRGASPSLERTRGAVERFIRHEREHGFGLWAVELRATGEFIGDCGLVYLEGIGPEG